MDFQAFVVLSIGVELMGNAFDEKEFTDFGESEIRFKNALGKLFKDNWYKNNKEFLYKQYRGPILHQYRTGEEIYLTSNVKNDAPLNEHLGLVNNKRVLVLEVLYEDFKAALKKLKGMIDKDQGVQKQKLEKPFTQIHRVKLVESNGDKLICDVSGVTHTIIDNSN